MSRRQDEFERVAMPHMRSLLRFACRLARDPVDAEDLVQEVYLSAWRAFRQFEPGTNARAWLFRILMNAWYARGRKIQTVTGPVAESASPPPEQASLDSIDVARALATLPVEHRTVLLLGVVEGFTCREMAEILAVPIGTVMS
ncbi:MAG TPA: sigma-70 family RNA polymerase sigma factor, partial [Bryobacteraceae bacterium]|nr:sigma-70 family RNA polymerase sigma factor [Bryobacteraceae bacterium]